MSGNRSRVPASARWAWGFAVTSYDPPHAALSYDPTGRATTRHDVAARRVLGSEVNGKNLIR
jgi:hypothetical protein